MHSIIMLKKPAILQRPLLTQPITPQGHRPIHPVTHTMRVGCHLSLDGRTIGSNLRLRTRHQAI